MSRMAFAADPALVGLATALARASPRSASGGVRVRSLVPSRDMPRLGADEVLRVLEHLVGAPLAEAVLTPDAFRRALPLAMACKDFYAVFTAAVRGIAFVPIGFAGPDERKSVAPAFPGAGGSNPTTTTTTSTRTSSGVSRSTSSPVDEPAAWRPTTREIELFEMSNQRPTVTENNDERMADNRSRLSPCRKVCAYALWRMLSALPAVVHLEITIAVALTDNGMLAVASACPNLRFLKASANRTITKASIRAMHRCRNLETLDLSFCKRFGDDAAPLLEEMHQLRSLSVSGWSISDDFIDLLLKNGGLPRLETIDMATCTEVSDKSICSVVQYLGERLRGLSIRACPRVTDDGIARLVVGSPLLERIDTSYDENLTSNGFAMFRDCLALTHVNVSSCEAVNDAAVAALARGGRLKEINLSWCAFLTDSAVKSLTSCGDLTRVNLNGCSKLTDDAIRSLAELPQLEWLGVSYCPELTDQGVDTFSRATNRTLRRMELQCCRKISADAIRRLRSAGVTT